MHAYCKLSSKTFGLFSLLRDFSKTFFPDDEASSSRLLRDFFVISPRLHSPTITE